MIAEYNRKSLYWGIPGIVFQIGSIIVLRISDIGPLTTGDSDFVNFLRTVQSVGTLLLLIGIVYYTKAIGQHWLWCLLAFIPFGVLILVLLKDKESSPTTSAEEAKSSAASKTSKLAISSLILGILGPLTIGLTSLLALILGILALKKIRRNSNLLKGRGLAIAGITISSILLAIFILFFSVFILSFLLNAR